MATTILLVDDHPLFRKGLRLLLEEQEDFRIVGEAGDGQEALDRFRELSPDVVVMDITMPNLNGIEATRQILSESPDTKVVALSIHAGKRFVQDMLAAGAAGYILKDSVPEELPNCIRKVIGGEVFLSSAITGVVVSEYVGLLSGAQGAEKEPAGPNVASADITIPIVKTKLYRPPCPEENVHRPHLVDKLDRNRTRPLTLVSAPAGYGKTTLISSWLESYDIPSAWVSLDENDNDFRMFLAYFLSAVQSIFPGVALETQAILNASELPPLRVLALNLINELDQIEKNFILVLDDYHVIHDKEVQDLLIELLKHPPAPMHLVLITRRDPSLPIATFRARSLTTEIRVQELRFTTAESATFLQQMTGRPVDDHIVAILEEKTEGWVTGLRLVALSLRHRSDMDRIIAQLPEDNCYVMDYIVAEVVTQQSPDIQKFLLMTSILDRFCAPLCEVVFSPNAESGTCVITGQEFLKNLEQSNLFVVPLDNQGRWFRYHHLFQQLLQHQLKNRFTSDDIAALYKKAGNWFEEEGLIDEALHCILSSGDIPAAARLIIAHRHDLINRERWYRLAQWIRLLPPDIIQKNPELLLSKAWVFQRQGKLAETWGLLDQIENLGRNGHFESAIEDPIHGEIQALRCFQHYVCAQGDLAEASAQEALNKISPKNHGARGMAYVVLALSIQMRGDIDGARQVVYEALSSEQASLIEDKALLMATFCFVDWVAADLKSLVHTAARYLSYGKKHHLLETIAVGNYFSGIMLYQLNELTKAESYLSNAVNVDFIPNVSYFTHSSFVLSLTYQAQGRNKEAIKTAEATIDYLLNTDNISLLELSKAFKAELALRQGYIAEADHWAKKYNPDPLMPSFRYFVPQLTLVKILLAKDTTDSRQKAFDLLLRFQTFFSSIHDTNTFIEVLALQALLHDARGAEPAALEILTRAITLAEPGGFIRLFVDLGLKMAALLSRLSNQKIALSYVGQLIAAFKDEEVGRVQAAAGSLTVDPLSSINQSLDEPLTKREFEILSLLEQRLRNKEIAEKLFISIETVKRHNINIYGKLNVNSRLEAIDRANALRKPKG